MNVFNWFDGGPADSVGASLASSYILVYFAVTIH